MIVCMEVMKPEPWWMRTSDYVTGTAGGSEFNAVPAATGRSRQDRSRSTGGLVSRSIGSISNLVSRHIA
jgi:hypothetical protein